MQTEIRVPQEAWRYFQSLASLIRGFNIDGSGDEVVLTPLADAESRGLERAAARVRESMSDAVKRLSRDYDERARKEQEEPAMSDKPRVKGDDVLEAIGLAIEALAAQRDEAKRERDEAQRVKYGTPCKCESWVAACGAAEDERDEARAEVERLKRDTEVRGEASTRQIGCLMAEVERLRGKLAQIVGDSGWLACEKCGAYHQSGHVCYRCGYDAALEQPRRTTEHDSAAMRRTRDPCADFEKEAASGGEE